MATINQTFDFKRFGNLSKKYFIENWRRMSIMFGCVTILMILMLLFLEHTTYRVSSGQIFFALAVITFVFGVVMASNMYRSLGTPATAITTLTTPASQFEGFLLRWIIAIPLFLVWAYVSALFADWMRMLYAHIMNHPADAADWGMLLTSDGEELDKIGFLDTNLGSFLSDFLCVQSFFLLGSVVWLKNALVKTLGAMFLIWLSYMFVTIGYATLIVDEANHYEKNFDLEMVSTVLGIGITLFNYLLTYMRFREAEIINRW